MKNKRIAAKELRKADERAKVPDDHPGYYKWWAKEEDFKYLLEKLDVDYETVKGNVEKDENGWYCIYVGIAVKDSLRYRVVDWHICQKHTKANGSSRSLSTLRQSISSLVTGNQMCEKETNAFIDKLEVEYFYDENDVIGSLEVKSRIKDTEHNFILCKLRILNIQDNTRDDAKTIRKKLTKLRRDARTRAMSDN